MLIPVKWEEAFGDDTVLIDEDEFDESKHERVTEGSKATPATEETPTSKPRRKK